MKKIIFIVLSLFIINYFFSFATAKDEYNYETKFNPQDMREDLLFLEKTIKEVHPNPYHFTSQVLFEKKMEELFNKIDKPLTYDEFYFIVLEATGLTKDSHTTAYYSKKQRELPIDWYCSKDWLFITKNNLFQIGDKVEKIGNKSVHEIVNEFKTMIPAENDYWVMSNLERRLKQEAFLRKLNLIDNNGKVRIEVKTANNITKVKTLDVCQAQFRPIMFRIHIKLSQTIVRPNPHNFSTTTLKPDVYIPYTRNNIVLGKDPAIDWLKAVK